MIEAMDALHSKKCLDVMDGCVEENCYSPIAISGVNENFCC